MTLVELLVVVFVIAVLTAMLLPMNPHRGRGVNKVRTRVEMSGLVTAIEAYESEYQHLPLADSATTEDATYGISPNDIPDFKAIDGTRFIATNSDLVIALMDFDHGINAAHQLNPKAIKFLNARVVEDTHSSGVSAVDHQYRDPWGNPYIITIDLNHDGQCIDFLYCRQKVSQAAINSPIGFNGLFNPADTNGDHFCVHGKVMIWSAGPDKKFDGQTPANAGVNKDNVLSWQ